MHLQRFLEWKFQNFSGGFPPDPLYFAPPSCPPAPHPTRKHFAQLRHCINITFAMQMYQPRFEKTALFQQPLDAWLAHE